MSISRKDKIRILEWRLENWQDDPDVLDKSPPELDICPEELEKFFINMITKYGSGDIIKITNEELESLKRDETCFSNAGNVTTITPSRSLVTFEFQTGSLTLTALPEKDGDERNKIASFVINGNDVKSKRDIKVSEAIEIMHKMGATPEQVHVAGDFFNGKIHKSETENERKISLTASTSEIEGKLEYDKKKTTK